MLKVIKKWLSGEDENQFPSPFTNKILQYCNTAILQYCNTAILQCS
ncbi:hypothetical protein N8944_01660 [Pseudomonadales bacterium]|nr:hypothetical protein [Pseudomonadales bacterium]